MEGKSGPFNECVEFEAFREVVTLHEHITRRCEVSCKQRTKFGKKVFTLYHGSVSLGAIYNIDMEGNIYCPNGKVVRGNIYGPFNGTELLKSEESVLTDRNITTDKSFNSSIVIFIDEIKEAHPFLSSIGTEVVPDGIMITNRGHSFIKVRFDGGIYTKGVDNRDGPFIPERLIGSIFSEYNGTELVSKTHSLNISHYPESDKRVTEKLARLSIAIPKLEELVNSLEFGAFVSMLESKSKIVAEILNKRGIRNNERVILLYYHEPEISYDRVFGVIDTEGNIYNYSASEGSIGNIYKSETLSGYR